MNKIFLGLTSLLLLVCLACNPPQLVEQEPLKTVESVRREAHRTTKPATEAMPENRNDDNDIDNDNAGMIPTAPAERPVPGVPTTTNTAELSAEFTEKTVSNLADVPAYLAPNEFAMVQEVNLMRRDPAAYISYVERYIDQVQNSSGYDAAYRAEEVATARELIAELEKLQPLSILKPHAGLYQVGVEHGKDIQQQGMIGHRGSDGTMPWDRVRNNTDLKDGNENLVGGGETVREQVMILLVDSGIPGRGHRKTLLEPKWTHVACHKIGEVGGVPNSWIQVFGNE